MSFSFTLIYTQINPVREPSKFVGCIDNSNLFVLLRHRDTNTRAENKPDGDTQRNIMENNTQPCAHGDPDGKPEAELVVFFSLILDLSVR